MAVVVDRCRGGGGGGGGHRGYRTRRLLLCLLASARWIVTILLSAVTLGVLAMALVVCLRPQNIDLSIPHGHVEANILLLHHPPSGPTTILRHANFSDLQRSSTSLDLWFSLSASNPSSRVSITCQDITIDIIDATQEVLVADEFPTSELVNITTVHLAVDPFRLMPESMVTIRKLATVTDPVALKNVSGDHEGYTAFEVILRVSLSISSSPASEVLKTRNRTVHYCWPVTIGLGPPTAHDDDPQGCRCTREEDLTFNNKPQNFYIGAAALSPSLLSPSPSP